MIINNKTETTQNTILKSICLSFYSLFFENKSPLNIINIYFLNPRPKVFAQIRLMLIKLIKIRVIQNTVSPKKDETVKTTGNT